MGDGWFHCRECRQKFTIRVGTLMARSHLSLHKWVKLFIFYSEHSYLPSARRIGRMLRITRKSGLRVLRRVRSHRYQPGHVWWENPE